MKKLIILICITLSLSTVYPQKLTMTISHTLVFDSISVLPDSIVITNINQGCDTILYSPDTNLVLDYTVGINEYEEDCNSFFVTNNYPNPFKEKTYFNVNIPEVGKLIIKVYDNYGRELSFFSDYYLSGRHRFMLQGLLNGLYILRIEFKNEVSSIKVSSVCSGKNNSSQIKYVNTISSQNNKILKSINGFGYIYGNQLRSIAYYQLLSDTVVYLPTKDTLIQLELLGSQICPATFTDVRDNHVYTAIQIGTQCWMAENLAYLPSVFPSDSGSYTLPYYYVYDYEDTVVSLAKATYNYRTYGVLYNWPAAMAGQSSSNSVPSGVQGVCPDGWHLPSDEEFKILEGDVDSQYGYPEAEWDNLGFRGTDAGGNLKVTDTTYWDSPNTGATNSSGFSALPAGGRAGSSSFWGLGDFTVFWTSRECSSSDAWYRRLYFNKATVYRSYIIFKNNGFSVRCCKDY